MKHLYQIARGHKALIAVFVIMGFVISFLQGFGPWYFQTVIDGFTGGSLTGPNIAIYGAVLILLIVEEGRFEDLLEKQRYFYELHNRG